MNKAEKKPKARRKVNVEDLAPKHTAKVKGGFNPQPEPPGDQAFTQVNPLRNIITPTIRRG